MYSEFRIQLEWQRYCPPLNREFRTLRTAVVKRGGRKVEKGEKDLKMALFGVFRGFGRGRPALVCDLVSELLK